MSSYQPLHEGWTVSGADVSGLAATGVDQINKQMKNCREKGADNEKEV